MSFLYVYQLLTNKNCLLETGIRVLYNIFASKRLIQIILFRTHWCITGKVPSINSVWTTKHFSSLYWFFKLCQSVKNRKEKWKTRPDSAYTFNHQPYRRMHLRQWGLESMCKCHFSVHLRKAKQNQILFWSNCNKRMMREGKHTMQSSAAPLPLAPNFSQWSRTAAFLVSHFLMHKMVKENWSQWSGIIYWYSLNDGLKIKTPWNWDEVSYESANSPSNTFCHGLANAIDLAADKANAYNMQPEHPCPKSSRHKLTVPVQVQRNISWKPTACSNLSPILFQQIDMTLSTLKEDRWG